MWSLRGHGLFLEFLDVAAGLVPKPAGFVEIFPFGRAFSFQRLYSAGRSVLQKTGQLDIGLGGKLHLLFLQVHDVFLLLDLLALLPQAPDEPFLDLFLELAVLDEPDEVDELDVQLFGQLLMLLGVERILRKPCAAGP